VHKKIPVQEHKFNVNASLLCLFEQGSCRVCFFSELIYRISVECESSVCLDNVYRRVVVSPAGSTVLFSAYHYGSVYVSVRMGMRVIYRYDGIAFEDAVGFEYFCDFVVCPCGGLLYLVSVLGFYFVSKCVVCRDPGG
jgi:hypothetical protein